MTANRFLEAGKDGYLEVLNQATKKDLNRADEGGMTATLWTAYHGHIDALRMCCSRGGNPDMCDLWGNTALHFTAKRGFTSCLVFLVTFGANLWQMDNDFLTAMDLATMHDNRKCVEYLNDAIAKQESLDRKHVSKLQEEAKKEAEKRCKKYQKMIQEQNDPHMSAVTEPNHGRLEGYNYVDEYSGNGFDHNLSSDNKIEVEATSLDTFLNSINLSEYSNFFKNEKMDMDALLLCSMDDLKKMRLPLGPRKKIIAGLGERKVILSLKEIEITKF